MFISALGIIYSAGRGDHLFTPEFFTARVVGIFAGIITCDFLLRRNNDRRRSRILGAYCVVIAFSLLFLEKSSDLLHQVYFAGFEQAVFSAGSVQQWESLVVFVSDCESRGIEWKGKPLPNFVKRVYSDHYPTVASMSMTPGTNDCLAFIWRGVSLDAILVVGHISSEEFDTANATCWKRYSNTILFKITGNE